MLRKEKLFATKKDALLVLWPLREDVPGLVAFWGHVFVSLFFSFFFRFEDTIPRLLWEFIIFPIG